MKLRELMEKTNGREKVEIVEMEHGARLQYVTKGLKEVHKELLEKKVVIQYLSLGEDGKPVLNIGV